MGREAARQKREREKRAGREKIQNIIISTMTRHDDDDNRRHVERVVGVQRRVTMTIHRTLDVLIGLVMSSVLLLHAMN